MACVFIIAENSDNLISELGDSYVTESTIPADCAAGGASSGGGNLLIRIGPHYSGTGAIDLGFGT